MSADIKTLAILADQMEKDSKQGFGLNNAAVRSIADIIRQSIGAPIQWPSRVAGCDKASELYPGSPDLRMAFNGGVAWAVQNYAPTEIVNLRFGKETT